MSKQRKEPRKKDKDWQKTLSRLFIVIILFACVVGFSLSFSFFSIFKKAEAGDIVTVDYTLYYDEGYPIISSDQYVVQKGYEEGIPVALTNPLQLQAGSLQSENIIPVNVYQYYLGNTQYALLDLEVDAMSSDVEEMHVNDVKKIDLEFAPGLTYNISAEQFDSVEGLNFSEAAVGLLMFPDLSGTYNVSGNATTIIRPSVIIEKTNDTAVLRYGYSFAEIQVNDIN